MRRALLSSAMIEQSSPILGLDNKPIATEANVRAAVQRVAKDLEDMRQRRGYSEGSGWAIEPPEGGENGISFRVMEGADEQTGAPSGEYVVVGQMIVRRD